jgi:FKBP-type peptidyl-prolyl cis-trans isomerase
MRLMTVCAVLVAALATTACGSDSSPSGTRGEDIPALRTEDLAIGTGQVAVSGQTISAHYTLWLYSSTAAGNKGQQIQRSRDSLTAAPRFALTPGSVITGWVQGIPGMQVGGTRRLFIPSALGYGPQGQGDIPGGSALVFDVELISIP